MNRRAFLALLGSGVIGAGLDVDRLLWVPGQRTIFLPPAGINSDAQEAQRMYNYFRSAQIEAIGLTPRVPWVRSNRFLINSWAMAS